MAEVHEILVLVQNPPEYVSWPAAQKLEFYEDVVGWHDHTARLMESGDVTRAWGAEKLPGRVRANATKTLLISLYRTTFARFSELIMQDPLWDTAWYEAPILKSIEGDYEDDVERVRRQRGLLGDQLGVKLPKPVVTFDGELPRIEPGGDIEMLVTSKNEPGYGILSEAERFGQDVRAVQMHDYHRPLREAGVITDEWGTYQNCGFGVYAGATRAMGVHISRVNSYDEFDALFLTDPVRSISRVRTVVLVPFDESRKRAERDLKVARKKLRSAPRG